MSDYTINCFRFIILYVFRAFSFRLLYIIVIFSLFNTYINIDIYTYVYKQSKPLSNT